MSKLLKIKIFWQKNEIIILIILAFLISIITAFKAGISYQKDSQQNQCKILLNDKNSYPLNPKQEKILALGEALLNENKESNQNNKQDQRQTENQFNSIEQKNTKTENRSQKCLLIGSKNSNKYHKSNCVWAKKIKPENRVCFSSEEEAKAKGYQPAGCCFK